MYNLLFGTNPLAPLLLDALNLSVSDVPRFRDAYVVKNIEYYDCYKEEGYFIAIYTRAGTLNWDWLEESVKQFKKHPLYFAFFDDEFDQTYGTFYFRIPEDWEFLTEFAEEWNPDEAWKNKMKELEQGKIPERAREVIGKILKEIKKTNSRDER